MLVLVILLLALLLGGVGLLVSALKALLIVAAILFLAGVVLGYASLIGRTGSSSRGR